MGGEAVTAAECHKCHRRISDAEQHHGFGPKCWRAVQAEALATAVRVHVANANRRWDAAMPGQESLDLQETA
jgi:1,6-anhydro-N-acetylmuramate kinase